MTRDLDRTLLFHITDISNLPGIAANGLLSDALLAAAGGPVADIGYSHIKRRRMTVTRVDCAGGLFVGEFVPFYFCPRSPMLFTVNKGNTGRPPGCQRSILHLVTTITAATNAGATWAYSDGNAGASYPSFYNDISQLDQRLNWAAINERDNWSPVRTEKQAEFLVAERFPWGSIRAIGCMEDSIAARVNSLLQGMPHRPTVVVRPSWYY